MEKPRCIHEQFQKGGNQYSSWKKCKDCLVVFDKQSKPQDIDETQQVEPEPLTEVDEQILDDLGEEFEKLSLPETKMGWVYVMYDPHYPTRFKIGRSDDPLRRLAQLQTGCPTLVIAYSKKVSNMNSVERRAHNKLAEKRPREKGRGNEWFNCTLVEAKDAIDNCFSYPKENEAE